MYKALNTIQLYSILHINKLITFGKDLKCANLIYSARFLLDKISPLLSFVAEVVELMSSKKYISHSDV